MALEQWSRDFPISQGHEFESIQGTIYSSPSTKNHNDILLGVRGLVLIWKSGLVIVLVKLLANDGRQVDDREPPRKDEERVAGHNADGQKLKWFIF